MDWFHSLTGFREIGYADTQNKLRVEGNRLRSLVNDRSYQIGALSMPSLGELRQRVGNLQIPAGRLRAEVVQGDVRQLHRDRENRGALFQVASQFNLLEMTGPGVTPEDGVTIYQHDRTQGPACAMEAGAATIYRNYLVPIGDDLGQTKDRQLDGLADIGSSLSDRLVMPVDRLWELRNGYALSSARGLHTIDDYLSAASGRDVDSLRDLLRIGLHRDVEVTTVNGGGQIVSQAFCSALPVSYSDIHSDGWERFARLVLEGAYEATLLCAAANAGKGGTGKVFLTLLGGGAFGNQSDWILDALDRAMWRTSNLPLDVKVVSYGRPSGALEAVTAKFS